MKTATEKLKAVNEGAMSPKEFVRQMRQEFPQHITQFNGFDDSVSILKNRGVIVEAKELKSLEDYSEGQALNIPLEAIERGVRYELNGLGHSTIDTCSEDEYNTCKATVVKNLEKDLNHYLNLLSGESNNVDKHDKETEVKRGEGAVDTFNGLKKADLKENTIKSTMKEGVVNIYNKYGKVPGFADLLKSFFEMHGKDIDAGADIEDEFTQFIMANSNLDEKKIKEDFSPSPNTHLPEFANGEDFDVATAFKKARVDMSKPVAVMYHYGHAQYSGEDTDIMSAEAAIRKIEAERQEVRKNYTDDGEEVPSDRHGYEFENYSVLEEHMPEGHEYKLSYYLDGDYTYAITQEKSGVSEKKGKDLDGDGDIDGDDYKHAKDRAIKKAMGKKEGKVNVNEVKTAIKTVISNILKEAHTPTLQSFIDREDTDTELEAAAKDLMNVIEQMESEFLKHKDKIAAAYEKAGAYMAPALEKAFAQDLNSQRVSFEKIELPATPKLTPDQVDQINQANEAGDVDEKTTIYTPTKK